MEPRFIAWSTDLGQTEDVGSTKITGVFYDAQDAATQWASRRDYSSAEYMIAFGGQSHRVTVKDCVTGDITEWEVCGDFEPAYHATDITGFRKVDDEH
jgi:hypothetical protein